MLSKVRSIVAAASAKVGEGYVAAKTQAAKKSQQAVVVSRFVFTQARDMTREDAQQAVVSFASGAVLGDFSKDPSVAAHAGRVVGNIVPVVGTAAAVRDGVAAAHRLSQGESKAAIDLTLTVLSFVPGARLATTAIRGAQNAMDSAAKLQGLANAVEQKAIADGSKKKVDDDGQLSLPFDEPR